MVLLRSSSIWDRRHRRPLRIAPLSSYPCASNEPLVPPTSRQRTLLGLSPSEVYLRAAIHILRRRVLTASFHPITCDVETSIGLVYFLLHLLSSAYDLASSEDAFPLGSRLLYGVRTFLCTPNSANAFISYSDDPIGNLSFSNFPNASNRRGLLDFLGGYECLK